ncbi:assimilatory sulfite reductase (NADPH) hemoprotein subunit [Dasania marina]|uniref:assimilatory sulfite reductase (NADPH) hemoprotein subunit n=1 Tax=Dasania marina TaxID=471499 RepID=UPI00036A9058|nr:assimilatory sulfite reductase (NADPH) hemoprotein subunit [Dasania marina]
MTYLADPNYIPVTDIEKGKAASKGLRSTLNESVADQLSGAVADSDIHTLKHHGTYQQFDRENQHERKKQFLEPEYSFMIRARIPGGVCSPKQWLALDEMCQEYANSSIRITTRQTFQLHGVIKSDLKPTFQAMNKVLMDSICGCGDVNRNVMCNPNPVDSHAHEEVFGWAKKLSEHLLPETRAYYDLWLDGEKVENPENVEEPIYGPYYLPRKFKVVVAVPPYNDVDIYAHCLGYIAIIEDGKLVGYNITAGGGLGMTHGDPKTYARLADHIGFCTPDQMLKVAEETVRIQRDYGNRVERRFARFKYTIGDRSIEWFKEELEKRCGFKLQADRPFEFISNSDRYGWIEGHDGNWHLNLFIENGRIKDDAEQGLQLLTGMRAIAEVHQGDFRMTPNQNIIIANITPENRPQIEALVEQYGLQTGPQVSLIRQNSMACVALPTCPLAMAESERYLPSLVTHIEKLAEKHGIADQPITIRMQGCPNGCGRAVLAEMSFIGKGPGRYNMYLGAGGHGERFSALYEENIDESEILTIADELLGKYAATRKTDERFGDFLVRTGEIKAYEGPQDFHRKEA